RRGSACRRRAFPACSASPRATTAASWGRSTCTCTGCSADPLPWRRSRRRPPRGGPMSRFHEVLRSGRVLLMDGAMGTELLRSGLPAGECLDMCNLTRPESVLAIHRAYAAAGAECLLTNTFQANPFALARHQLADRLEEIQRAGVALARSAAGPERFVLGDGGPLSPPSPVPSLTDRCDLRRPLRGLHGV